MSEPLVKSEDWSVQVDADGSVCVSTQNIHHPANIYFGAVGGKKEFAGFAAPCGITLLGKLVASCECEFRLAITDGWGDIIGYSDVKMVTPTAFPRA
jgi:hypothetical protein